MFLSVSQTPEQVESTKAESRELKMIVILTALRLERDAMLRHMMNVKEISEDGRLVHCGKIGNCDVVLECLHGMGNVRSAAGATRIISKWKPQCVLLVGIAGGTERPTKEEELTAMTHLLGDVLVAEQIVDYEFGKQEPNGLEQRFQVYRSTARLLAATKELSPQNWIHRINSPRPDGSAGRVQPQVHFGTIGSGQKVITDPSFIDPLKAVWTQLIGVEMEGLGAALACAEHGQPVEFLMAKGICDWADPEKNDGWQPYAADASASLIAALIECSYATGNLGGQVSANPVASSLTGEHKLSFCYRLGQSWKDLADVIGIQRHERDRFDKGDEPRAIWEWIEARNRLSELPDALTKVGRQDLARELSPNP